MATAAARFPFVSRSEILRAYRPGTEPSESTFRTLRQHGFVSGGIALRPRREGRVSGQVRCYATLNLDAVVFARQNRRDEALAVAAEAARFEADSDQFLDELIGRGDYEDFEDFRVSARQEFGAELAPLAEQLERLRNELVHGSLAPLQEEFVRISEITGQWAKLNVLPPPFEFAALDAIRLAITDSFEPIRQLVVNAQLAIGAHLQVGDLGLLRIEHTAGASVVSLFPGIEEDEPFHLDDEFTPYFSEEPLPRDVLADLHSRRESGDVIAVAPLSIELAS